MERKKNVSHNFRFCYSCALESLEIVFEGGRERSQNDHDFLVSVAVKAC